MTAISPPSPKLQIDAALEAFRTRDRDRAADILRTLIAAGPALGGTWGSIARMAGGLGEVGLAIRAAQHHAASNRGDIAAGLNLGQLLAQNGRAPEAVAVADRLTAAFPGQPAVWHFRGSCRAQLGETAAALEDFRKAISLSRDPALTAPSWLAIAEGKTFADDDPDLARMEQVLAEWPAGAPVEARAAILYAIGKAKDGLGRTKEAFAAYDQGARLMAQVRPDDAREADALVDQVVTGFTADRLARLKPSSIDSRRPIFVLGMPRSGTTLVEQILVSHRDVTDGAEVNLFRPAAMPIGGFSPDAIEAYAAANPGGLDGIARAYLHLLDERFGPSGRVVDKTLNHSRYLGLVHRVLPNARFVWLRREPGAVAWSAFRTWFAQGVNWSWSQEAIARYFKAEDRLHAHWTQVMGDAILTVPYEALVSDPKPWIARILDHVGLPFEDGLEDFHMTDRAVTTASFAQVRRPMYTTAASAWRSYEADLQPFFTTYRS